MTRLIYQHAYGVFLSTVFCIYTNNSLLFLKPLNIQKKLVSVTKYAYTCIPVAG